MLLTVTVATCPGIIVNDEGEREAAAAGSINGSRLSSPINWLRMFTSESLSMADLPGVPLSGPVYWSIKILANNENLRQADAFAKGLAQNLLPWMDRPAQSRSLAGQSGNPEGSSLRTETDQP